MKEYKDQEIYFRDRKEAGEKLAGELSDLKDNSEVVYALPRGGVTVAAEIAAKLGLPLDLIIVQKIAHPYDPELAIGAIAENGHVVGNVLEPDRIDENWLKEELIRLTAEINRKKELYLKNRNRISPKGKKIIIVDDGVATGSTLFAAIKYVEDLGAKEITVAIPIISFDIAAQVREKVDHLITLVTPILFLGSVGVYYDNFEQVSDREVINTLKVFKTDKFQGE